MPSPIPTNNSGVSQVLLNGEEIMTTMGDTVSPDNLLEGETATDKSGGKIEGAIDPVEQGDFDLLEQDVEELKSQTYNILDEEGEITDDDFVPFQDVSDSAKPKKKVTFGTILEKFKGLYAFISGSNIKDPNTFRSNIKTIDQLGTNIPDDANLDDYKTAGTYRVVSDASGASITNLPLALCGKVVVFANGNGGFEQFYFPNHSPRVFARTIFGDESWSDWKEFGDTNFWALKGGTKIPQNADLNTYTTVGNYYIALDADAQTISNRPVSTAGRLFVIESFDSSNYKIQLYYQRAIAMGVWQRSTSNNGSSWGDWVCNYITTQGNPINTLVFNSRIGNIWSQLKHRIGADKRLALNFSTDNGSTWDGDKVLALLSDCITQTGTAIPSNSNLNAYQTGGNYYVLDSTTASTISNLPVASAGKLLVIKRDTGARLFQIYMAGEKAIYIRSMDNSTNFTNWISFANSANSYNILGTASEIPANSDLDTYTTAGTYDCFTASNAQSLSNCPVGLAFKLLVDVEHNPAVVTQTITLLNSNSQMPFRRSKENTGSWGAWKQYASLTDVSSVNEKFSVAGNMINDFNDVSFFQSFFVANSSRILPFKSATANQPAVPASWGFCIIYFGGSNANFSLFYVNVENYVYTRGYINGAWRDWELISHKTHHLYQVDNAHQITANQDLNDYTTAGTYKCGNASIATTLTNCPVNVSFKLVVDRAYVDTKSEITQRITCMNSADYPEYYRTRQYNASSWGAWKSLVIAKASTVNNVKKIEMVTRSADGTWADFVFNDSDNHIKQKFHNGTSWGTEETLANIADFQDKTHWLDGGTDANHKILRTDDLNDFTSAGTYQYSHDNNGLPANCPFTAIHSFKLVVDKYTNNDSKSEIMQRITMQNAYNSNIDLMDWYRVRPYGSSNWSAWKHVASTDNTVSFWNLTDTGAQIPNNSDLNTYINAGKFYSQNSASSATITNAPITNGGFTLYVMKRTNLSQVTQLAFANNSGNCDEYMRNYDTGNTTWSAWKKVAFTSDIVPADVGDGYAVGTVSGSAITATITGFKLKAGVIVAIKISSEMTSACTLNINSTGAKYIKFWNDEDPSYGKGVGKSQVTTFMYDGTYYRVLAFDRVPSVGMSGYSADTSGAIMLDWGYGVNRAQLKYDIPNNRLRWNYYKNSAWRGDVDVLDYDRICKNLSNISSLDDIPLNSFGVVAFATNSGLEPVSGLNSYHYECTGYGNGGKKLTLTRYNSVFNDSQAKWERVKNDVGWTSYWVDYTPRGTYVGTCTTAGGTKDKEATVESGFKLITGVRVAIKFTNTNTYNSQLSSPVTLNVNGTGAKNIWINNYHTGSVNFGTSQEYLGYANRYIFYIYDGTYWVWDGCGVDYNNTSYLPNNANAILTASNHPFIQIKASNIDIAQANNGVSANQYPAYIIADKNGVATTRLESIVESGGLVQTRLYVQNKKSDGTVASIGINLRMDKSLNGSYKIDNNGRFNLALGFAIASDSRTSASATITASASYYTLGSNAIVWVNFNYDVPASSTLNINSCGARNINYRGASILANVIKAGDRAIFFYNGSYNLFCIDREAVERTFTATLSANATSVTFTGLPTSGNYIYDIFTSKAGLCYNSINDATSGQITVTYDAQSSAVTVYLKVRNA